MGLKKKKSSKRSTGGRKGSSGSSHSSSKRKSGSSYAGKKSSGSVHSSKKRSKKSSRSRKKKSPVVPVIIVVVVIAAALVLGMKSGILVLSAYTGDYDGLTEITERRIKTDEDSGIEYVNNTILAIVDGSASDEEKKELAKTVKGKTIGEITGTVDIMQIRVRSGSPDELQELAEELAESDLVYFVSYDYVVGSDGSAAAALASIFGESEVTEELGSLFEEAGEELNDLYEALTGTTSEETGTEEETEESEQYLLSELLTEMME